MLDLRHVGQMDLRVDYQSFKVLIVKYQISIHVNLGLTHSELGCMAESYLVRPRNSDFQKVYDPGLAVGVLSSHG